LDLLFIYSTKIDDNEKFAFQIISFTIIIIFSVFPITIIKMSVSGNELLVEAISAAGSSSKDQFGTTQTSSAKDISNLLVTYPDYLTQEQNEF